MNTSKDDPKKNEKILAELLKEEANKYCADCGQKGTRWASWNIGVFLCIKCGGLHRKLGTHISRVKSVTLDKWTDEQISSIKEKGNAKVNAIYNPNPERFKVPSYAGDMEQYIRDKYERKIFMNSSSVHRSSSIPSSTSAATKTTAATITTTTANKSYQEQMIKLREMGFTQPVANMTALQATNGNLQEAIDRLVSHSPNLDIPKKKEASVEDLLGSSFTEKDQDKSALDDWTEMRTSIGEQSKPKLSPTTDPWKTTPSNSVMASFDPEKDPFSDLEFPK